MIDNHTTEPNDEQPMCTHSEPSPGLLYHGSQRFMLWDRPGWIDALRLINDPTGPFPRLKWREEYEDDDR